MATLLRNFLYDGKASIHAFLLIPVKTEYAILTLNPDYKVEVERTFKGPHDVQLDTHINAARVALQAKAKAERWFFKPERIVARFMRQMMTH